MTTENTETTTEEQATIDSELDTASVTLGAGQIFDRLRAASNLTERGVFTLDKDGLHLRTTDFAHVAMVDIDIPLIDEMGLPEPIEFGADLEEFADDVGLVASRHDEVELTYNYRDENLHAHVGSDSAMVIIVEPDEVRGTNLVPNVGDELTTKATVNSSRLNGILSGVSHSVSDHQSLGVTLIARDGEFGAARETGVDEYTDEWMVPDEATVGVETPDQSETLSTFSEHYLNEIAGALPRDWNVDVEFAADYPIRIRVVEGWDYWLAPKLIDEEIDEETEA